MEVVLDMSRTENQLFCDRRRFSGERLADGEWNNHVMLEEPVEIMLTGKVSVFSDSGLLDDTTASLFLEKIAETVMKKVSLARTEATLPGRRFRLNGSYVLETHRCRYSKSYNISCRRLGAYARVFQTDSSFTSMIPR